MATAASRAVPQPGIRDGAAHPPNFQSSAPQPLFTRPVREAFIKRSQTFPVLRASALGDVVVVRSGNRPKVFRFPRRAEQRPAESHWDGLIGAAVDEKDRGLNSRDLPARIEAP